MISSDRIDSTLTIQPEGDGCIGTVIHEMDAKWAGYVAQTENAWSCMMQATDVLLARGSATP